MLTFIRVLQCCWSTIPVCSQSNSKQQPLINSSVSSLEVPNPFSVNNDDAFKLATVPNPLSVINRDVIESLHLIQCTNTYLLLCKVLLDQVWLMTFLSQIPLQCYLQMTDNNYQISLCVWLVHLMHLHEHNLHVRLLNSTSLNANDKLLLYLCISTFIVLKLTSMLTLLRPAGFPPGGSEPIPTYRALGVGVSQTLKLSGTAQNLSSGWPRSLALL